MLILGISDFWRHPAAAIVRDGEILAFAEEERFLRIKGAPGRFPVRALSYCLREAGARLGEVDAIAYGWDAKRYPGGMLLSYARMALRSRRGRGLGRLGADLLGGEGAGSEALRSLDYYRPATVRSRILHGLRAAGQEGPLPPLRFVPHHLAHAASAFFLSGFDRAAVVIVDGSGEDHCTSIYAGSADRLDLRAQQDMPDSLGWFYAALTAWLGFVPYQQEGQVMALAPFGRRAPELEARLRQVIWAGRRGRVRVDSSYTLLGDHAHSPHFADRLVGLLGPPRLPGQPLTDRHRDVARLAQVLLEEACRGILQLALDLCGPGPVCLAGGVALNCKMNGVLSREPGVEALFVQPAAHDAGAALGAALWLGAREGDRVRRRQRHSCWGPAFEAGEIRAALDLAGARYREPSDLPAAAAEALSAGKVVGWFQGRMEAGPRALGHRSILADPRHEATRDLLNARVKHRQPWRPFCPSLHAEAAKDYLEGEGEGDGRFMIVARQVRPGRIPAIPAVVHVDGSTRPQIVDADTEPGYYRLLSEVAERTGHPVLLNTSFNDRGEPIVCTPADALRCFHGTRMDLLAIGPFLVEK